MALVHRFNPPPSWPPPPSGWEPPPGWFPDPSWGPPPPGWPLWVRVRANPRAWAWSLLSAAAWFVVLVAIGVTVAGGAFSAAAAGEIFGRELFAGVLTGALAWTRTHRWRGYAYPLVVLGFSVAFSVLTTVGRMNGT